MRNYVTPKERKKHMLTCESDNQNDARTLHDKLLLSREIERINDEKKRHRHSDEWKWILEVFAQILT